MIGQTISHYRILEKLGEVRLVPQSGTDEIRPLVETSTLAVCESRAPSFGRGSSSSEVSFHVVGGSSQFMSVVKRSV